MNKYLLLALGLIVSSSFVMSNVALAADQNIEDDCYYLADSKNLPDDKYDEFVAKCIADAEAKSGK